MLSLLVALMCGKVSLGVLISFLILLFMHGPLQWSDCLALVSHGYSCKRVCQCRHIQGRRFRRLLPIRSSMHSACEVPYIACVSHDFERKFSHELKQPAFRIRKSRCAMGRPCNTNWFDQTKLRNSRDLSRTSFTKAFCRPDGFCKRDGHGSYNTETQVQTSTIWQYNLSVKIICFLQASMNCVLFLGVAKGLSLGFCIGRWRSIPICIIRAFVCVCLQALPWNAIGVCHYLSWNKSVCHGTYHRRKPRIDSLNWSVAKRACKAWCFLDGEWKRFWKFGSSCCFHFKNVWISNWRLWMLLIYLLCTPVGEALNPGPSWHVNFPKHDNFLWIGNANPAQLLHKEQFISEWGKGVWTFSETSATERAIPTIRKRIKSQGFNVLFGAPVAPQQKTTIMRGKAGGVATATSQPIRAYAYPMPQFLHQSTRFMDCVVQVNNQQSIYVSTIYGVAGQSSAHPLSLTIDIFNQAAERALSFKGPAVICGDVNVPIESLEMWETLKNLGWFDAALVDSVKFQRELQPTSKHGTRHSYILMNRHMAAAFHSCRTSADFEFDAHPLLVAGFNMEVMNVMQKEWILPKSFDSFMFDPKVLEDSIQKYTSQNDDRFHAALESSNMNEVAKCFTMTAEEIFRHSAVDCEGNKVEIPPGHLGRASGKLFRNRRTCVPCIKPGRKGDFNPIMSQATSSIRYHTKQVRRLMSLKNQRVALFKNHSIRAHEQCQELWDAIINAHGFRRGFASWIFDFLHCVVPLKLPDIEFLEALTEEFQKYHNNNVQRHYLACCSKAKIDLQVDIQKGGSRCFSEVKDTPNPPLDAIHWVEECNVLRVAWEKKGKSDIPMKNKPDFDKEFPVTFQGQERYVVDMTSHKVSLDSPVTLKNSHDLTIRQEKSSAKPSDMHKQLEKIWGSLWQRDPETENMQEQDDRWNESINFLTCLSDCPSCPYKPLTRELWRASLKGVKAKSARGADGFSTRDYQLLDHQILDWLLMILRSIENGNQWPEQWSVSKVTVLGKGSKPKSPLDIRPITILPKVYRLWSRLRSLEVLRHLHTLMPPEVAATAGGISADQIASYTSCLIEQSRDGGNHICGLIIDLIKCYNTIPWEPCKRMLTHVGIPEQYQKPFFVFMKNLKRAFEVHGNCGEFIECTTGVPEGCAMSVAIMSALSWWCYAVMSQKHGQVGTIAYADNWSLIARESQELFNGTNTLFSFIDAFKMKISIQKSWFWGSSCDLRKHL